MRLVPKIVLGSLGRCFLQLVVVRFLGRVVADPFVDNDSIVIQYEDRPLCNSVSLEVAEVFVVDIVELDDFSIVVREYREVEVVILCERLVREWIVDADPYNLRIYLVQFLHVVAQCAHFTGAYRGECSGEKREECCAVGFQKLLTTARFSVGVGKREARSFFALVDHS